MRKIARGSRDVNCFGHAMGVNDWLDFRTVPYGIYDSLTVKNFFSSMLAELINKYKLKVVGEDYVHSRKHLNEKIIAFRLSNDDFHFCVRNNRRWTQKLGAGAIFLCTRKEVMNEIWGKDRFYPYDSEIIYFTVPN